MSNFYILSLYPCCAYQLQQKCSNMKKQQKQRIKITLLSLTSKTYITILYHGMYLVISTNLVKGESHFMLFATAYLLQKTMLYLSSRFHIKIILFFIIIKYYMNQKKILEASLMLEYIFILIF